MRRIYLDYNATQPISRKHFEEIGNILFECDANPACQHSYGVDAKLCLEQSRGALARALGAKKKEIYFTSGGTESNNLVIQGVIRAWIEKHPDRIPHIISSPLEHASIYVPIQTAMQQGQCSVTYVTPDAHGRLDAEELRQALRPETCLVALMLANNEIGNIYPIDIYSRLVHESHPQVHFHSDAVQAIGKVHNFREMLAGVDSVSLSGHKIGALKGCGALFLKSGRLIEPHQSGGGQESGLRPGTHNMPGIVSLGLKFAAMESLIENYQRLGQLRQRLLNTLREVSGLYFHGDLEASLPNTLNFHVEGLLNGELIEGLACKGISVSGASACGSYKGAGSRILSSLGLTEAVAANSVRISLGPDSSDDDAQAVIQCILDLRK